MVDQKKRKPWIHLAFISSYPRKKKERCWFPPTSWLLESLKLEMWMVGWCRMCGSRPKFLKPPSSEGKFQGIYLSTTSTNRMNDSNLVTTSVQAQRLDFTSQKLGAFTVLLNKSKVFLGDNFVKDPFVVTQSIFWDILNQTYETHLLQEHHHPCKVSSYQL